MSYLHIDNLYKPSAQHILLFKEIYAMEKIHGTSAHISWNDEKLGFFSGGESHDRFVALFDQEALVARLKALVGFAKAIIYGEAYGGKQQGMADTYGPNLKFVAFDVQINDCWLAVDQAAGFCGAIGIEFVDYVRIPATLAAIDEQRDRPSTQAARNGITGDRIREGVVLRSLLELTLNNGERIIAKHKRDEFRETGRPKPVVSAEKAEVEMRAKAIALDWVTPMRLTHVIDRLVRDREDKQPALQDIPELIKLMCEDVRREGEGLIVITDEKAFNKAVGSRTVKLLKEHLMEGIRES
jgi:hypothetical protein